MLDTYMAMAAWNGRLAVFGSCLDVAHVSLWEGAYCERGRVNFRIFGAYTALPTLKGPGF